MLGMCSALESREMKRQRRGLREVNSAIAAHSLQPRAKWAVDQAARERTSFPPQYSVAATVAHTQHCCRALLTLSPRASTSCAHTHSHYTRSSQADHTVCRYTVTSKITDNNNHHSGLCPPIVHCLFLGTFRHLHLSLIGSHCCCEQSGPDLLPDAIAHS
jgi:hypothetical protein